MESRPRQRRLFRRYDEFEKKELKKTATADRNRDGLGKINAKEAAELESKAAEYQKEQAELAKIEFELSSRSNPDRF